MVCPDILVLPKVALLACIIEHFDKVPVGPMTACPDQEVSIATVRLCCKQNVNTTTERSS